MNKKAFKAIITSFGGFFSFIYPYSLYRKLSFVYERTYSNWIIKSIGVVQGNVMICSHCSLYGGKNIEMKNGCSLGKYCNIETWEVNAVIPRLVFCENCCIGEL